MSDKLAKNNRVPSIDRFRGTVIFCMVIFQFIAYFDNLGVIANISAHAPDANAIYILPNFAIADVIAPMFILAIGLTFVKSFRRREEKDGTKKAVIHFVKRNLTLIGIGVVMNGINNILNGEFKPLNIARLHSQWVCSFQAYSHSFSQNCRKSGRFSPPHLNGFFL